MAASTPIPLEYGFTQTLACRTYPNRIEATIEVPMDAIKKVPHVKGKRQVFPFTSDGPRTAWKMTFKFCKGCRNKQFLLCSLIAVDLSGLPSEIAIGQLTVVTDEYDNCPSFVAEVAHVWRVGRKNNSLYLMESRHVPPFLKLTFRLLYANMEIEDLLPQDCLGTKQFFELRTCPGCRAFVAAEVVTNFKDLDHSDLGQGSALFSPCFGIYEEKIVFVCILYPRGTVLTPDYVTASIQLVHVPEFLLDWKNGLDATCGIALDNGHKKYEKTKLKESTIVGWAFNEYPVDRERYAIKMSVRIDVQLPTWNTVCEHRKKIQEEEEEKRKSDEEFPTFLEEIDDKAVDKEVLEQNNERVEEKEEKGETETEEIREDTEKSEDSEIRKSGGEAGEGKSKETEETKTKEEKKESARFKKWLKMTDRQRRMLFEKKKAEVVAKWRIIRKLRLQEHHSEAEIQETLKQEAEELEDIQTEFGFSPNDVGSSSKPYEAINFIKAKYTGSKSNESSQNNQDDDEWK